jgi:hypothetical protein
MIVPDHAAAIAGVSTRIIYRWLDTEKLHFLENPDGLLICLNSLTRASVAKQIANDSQKKPERGINE